MITFNEYQLKLLGVIGTWLAGIGTVGAVITSLYFAIGDRRIKLKVNVGKRLVLNAVGKKWYCVISIINAGFRSVVIDSYGWNIGPLSDTDLMEPIWLIQGPGESLLSSSLPCKLDSGERAAFYIPIEEPNKDWEDSILDLLGQYPKISIKTMRATVYISTGEVFKAIPEKSLIDYFLDYYDERENQ